jgi:UDP-glucose 4-epimerase
MQILVTGSSGFVGSRLLKSSEFKNQVQTVSLQQAAPSQIDFSGIQTIIHLAGIAHRMEPTPDELYFSINHELTLQFATAAKNAGVKHFIFLSTIKVYGDEQLQTQEISESTPCHPNDAYGGSKMKAEQDLRLLEDENFEVSIIRPPLIVGPDAKGNLLALMKLAQKPLPLPFGNIPNERAMIHLDNLIAFIRHLVNQPTSGIFLINENQPLSTTELIAEIRKSMGYNRSWLISIPGFFRSLLARFKPELHHRLFGSIQIKCTQSFERTGFTLPFELTEGIQLMTQEFLKRK